MYEEQIPTHKIGVLAPRHVIDNQAYEFYRMAPPGVMLVMTPMGLEEFSGADIQRVIAGADTRIDLLAERGVEIILASGVPLPILLGLEGHDRLLAHITERTGIPATSNMENVLAAARHLGLSKVVVANKWSDGMNETLGAFFARDGMEVVGVANKSMQPAEFSKISSGNSARLAYDLGRQALERHPEADGLFIGGGNWLSQPVVEQLEEEFGKPAFCNQGAMMWTLLHRIDFWRPMPGHGRLLSSD